MEGGTVGQVLHGSATTTEAIRRAIQRSQESLRTLAKQHGINPKTVAKWNKRSSVADLPTGPKQPASTVLSIEEEAIVIAFRRHTLLELCAEVGDGLTGRRRRIVGVFEPPLLQQRSDTPCPMLTWSSCFSQGRSPIRSPRCCATERAPYWPKRLRPRWRDSSPSMSI